MQRLGALTLLTAVGNLCRDRPLLQLTRAGCVRAGAKRTEEAKIYQQQRCLAAVP